MMSTMTLMMTRTGVSPGPAATDVHIVPVPCDEGDDGSIPSDSYNDMVRVETFIL